MRYRVLTEQLKSLRSGLIGGSSGALKDWVRKADEELSSAEANALIGAFKRAGEEFIGRPDMPRMPLELRQRILPSALHQSQWELEATVLSALSRAMEHLRFHPRVWNYRFHQVVHEVQPEPDSLCLRLDPHIVGPLLSELLPIEGPDADDLTGTPGVRVCWQEAGRLQISLLDSSPVAQVFITGVADYSWRAARAYVQAERPAALLLDLNHPGSLSTTEASAMRRRPRVYGAVHLASGLLRRIRAFRDVWLISVIERGTDELDVEWRGTPTAHELLTALCHPAAPISRGRFSATSWPGLESATIRDIDSPERRSGPRLTRGGELRLQRLNPSPPQQLYLKAGKMGEAWCAWEAKFTAERSSTGKARHRTAGGPSRLDELIGLRCQYTGDTLDSVHKRLKRFAAQADTKVLRAGVIPEAHSIHQRILETSILLAIRHCAPTISDRPYTGHQPIRTVCPHTNGLTIELDDDVLEPFFRYLVAPENPSDGGSDGVPGLRVVPGPEVLRLRLLDVPNVPTDAMVAIKGLSAARWEQIWRRIRNADYDSGPCIDPHLSRTPKLSMGERDGLDFQRGRCGPVALGSALLRRWGLLASAYAVDVWPGLGDREIHVEIHDGPSIESVVESLQHPILGMVDKTVTVDRVVPGFARLLDNRPTPDRFTGDPTAFEKQPGLVLRALSRKKS